jgi:hypothetical protein
MPRAKSASARLTTSIHRELDLWQDNGAVANFWWRDDDAYIDNDRFRRLVGLADVTGAPIILAVSPGLMSESFVATLNGIRNVSVAAHGFRHVNHSKSRQSGEFWHDRPLSVMSAEIENLATVFASMFPNRGLSMFVPPWHRFDPQLSPYLMRAGFKILSMHESFTVRALQIIAAKLPRFKMAFAKPASKATVPDGMKRVDIAINLLKIGPHHQGTANPLLIEHVIGALRLRRLGFIDANRPIGLMTHHLQHDELAWEQLSQLVTAIAEHPASYFIQPENICPLFNIK